MSTEDDPFDHNFTICDFCSKDIAIEEVESCEKCGQEMCDDCVISDHDCEGE